ncbi:hypothetical protein ASPVEDRAFT_83842 [Aspergillus versicolor CBS 583.65]|uniref:O-methyltransferase C-terminal domain-containing protein n=1 Tax=Aspergillus versicolor CBS 583.65 TaxID=1036611 RepID=A0A1L9PLE3_ASPVE|nr:uncharacterized protein ASPVEDRAFT_83842 [Aspergillus versicolor CBS 583.65]OJJ02334.1 hypothetical protein ASPVEDRAFT_83842 [Aspergillus versicolor CBS 583.65]
MASQIEDTHEGLTTLASRLQGLVSRLGNDGDHEAKSECLHLAKALTAQLEPPEHTAIDMAFSPLIATSVRIASDLNLFEHIVRGGPVTSARLAALSGAEELFIIRILRVASSVHFVEETAVNTWKATRVTEVMARKGIAAGHRVVSQVIAKAMQSAPDFFRQRGQYAFPTDPKDGLVQFAFNTEQTTFDYIGSDPSMLADFNITMEAAAGKRMKWTEWYPVQSRVLDGALEGTVLMVDVGGGDGHDILDFNSKFPNSGRLVLEDLGVVTEGIREFDKSIEKISYDFFTEQPVKGARVYFYHHIFHDWSDDYCHKILQRVAAAMTPGYSKLLINEMLVPEQGATKYQAQSDIAMMAFGGGMERTKSQWRTLLGTAGFQIVEFWEPADEGDGIIEAVY